MLLGVTRDYVLLDDLLNWAFNQGIAPFGTGQACELALVNNLLLSGWSLQQRCLNY